MTLKGNAVDELHLAILTKGFEDLYDCCHRAYKSKRDPLGRMDAMAHPEDYHWLLVRISGYNAYFTKINRNMQEELIERQEFK